MWVRVMTKSSMAGRAARRLRRQCREAQVGTGSGHCMHQHSEETRRPPPPVDHCPPATAALDRPRRPAERGDAAKPSSLSGAPNARGTPASPAPNSPSRAPAIESPVFAFAAAAGRPRHDARRARSEFSQALALRLPSVPRHRRPLHPCEDPPVFFPRRAAAANPHDASREAPAMIHPP